MLLAFQIKETIILATVPLLLYEKLWKERLFLLISAFGVILTRIVFQLGDTGSYAHFATTENFFYKLYFLILHPMNLSPFAMPLGVGIAALFLVAIVFIYFLRMKREAFFFAALFFTFVLFFAFLPKLSSKYYFYPCFAFWGLAALLGNRFYREGKSRRYVRLMLFFLLGISLAFNYPALKREIEDYRILGDFSKKYIAKQASLIKARVDLSSGVSELSIEKQDNRPLAQTYQEVYRRQNLLKLLPFRKKSIGGLITPTTLVPFIFYPKRVVRWQSIAETDSHFLGRCLTSSPGE